MAQPDSASTNHNAVDIAFVSFLVPDLDRLEDFLVKFGLIAVHRNEREIYMRGSANELYCYTASKGQPGFSSLAFELKSLAALNLFSEKFSTPIEALSGPVEGYRVRQTDPDGFQIDAVFFTNRPLALPLKSPTPTNEASIKARYNAERRVEPGPGEVCRLGHAVLNVTDFRRSEEWYKKRFGFITSDEIAAESGEAIGAFLRCDRGEAFTDHHTLFLMQSEQAIFNHAAFEMRDLDDLMVGHDTLEKNGFDHRWGIGRHVLGSQIFDYWRDPWGHVLEHWTDGDLMNAAWGSRRSSISRLRSVQWGSPPPRER